MPHVQFSIDGQEVDPCEHMRTILERLQACESSLGLRLLGRPGTPLRPLLSASTQQQPRRSGGLASPESAIPTSPAGAAFLVDPDSPADFPTFIDPNAGFLTHDGFVNVEEPDGTVTRKPLIPLDLKLVEAIQGKRSTQDKVISSIILGVSKTAARLLNYPEDTVSATLARIGNTTVKAVHLDLLLPIIKVSPPAVRKGILEFLTDEADISLLQRDLFDLEQQVKVLDRGFDIPFFQGPKDEREAFDRIRGNLEILRIEAQEEL